MYPWQRQSSPRAISSSNDTEDDKSPHRRRMTLHSHGWGSWTLVSACHQWMDYYRMLNQCPLPWPWHHCSLLSWTCTPRAVNCLWLQQPSTPPPLPSLSTHLPLPPSRAWSLAHPEMNKYTGYNKRRYMSKASGWHSTFSTGVDKWADRSVHDDRAMTATPLNKPINTWTHPWQQWLLTWDGVLLVLTMDGWMECNWQWMDGWTVLQTTKLKPFVD